GEIAGGTAAWAAAGRPLARLALVAPGDLEPSRTVDVRQDREFHAGHVAGALHVELGRLGDAAAELPSGPLTIAWGPGEGAMTAASVLAAGGRPDVSVLIGGPDDWAAATGRALDR